MFEVFDTFSCVRLGLVEASVKDAPNIPDKISETNILCLVVKIMVPFWVLRIRRHLVFRGPERGQ